MTIWRKSSHSGQGGTGECVEVAELDSNVGIRDSKAPGAGHLTLSRGGFANLVGCVKRGEARSFS